MGYRSNFMLSAEPITEELYTKIEEELQLYNCRCECEGVENGVGQWSDIDDTWYSSMADMVQISQVFPDVIFTLYVEGEDRNDTWRAIFHNGRFQVNEATFVFDPFIPSRMKDTLDEPPQEYEKMVREERIKAVETAIYHCLRTVLGREEEDFPWDPILMKETVAACKEYLKARGFEIPEGEQAMPVKTEKEGAEADGRGQA